MLSLKGRCNRWWCPTSFAGTSDNSVNLHFRSAARICAVSIRPGRSILFSRSAICSGFVGTGIRAHGAAAPSCTGEGRCLKARGVSCNCNPHQNPLSNP